MTQILPSVYIQRFFWWYEYLNKMLASLWGKGGGHVVIKTFTRLKDILLRCELKVNDVAAVLVTAVLSVFSAATAVKTAIRVETLKPQQ